MSNKVTNKDAMNAVRAFTEQSEKNIAFGVLADTENGNFSTFIKGEELEILAMIAMQMAKDNNFKKLIFKSVSIYECVPVQEMIDKYEQSRWHYGSY